MKKNFVLDMLLLVSGAACIVTGVILDFHLFFGGREVKFLITEIHRWTGYIMTIGIVLHFIWHWKWLKAIAGQLSAKKQ